MAYGLELRDANGNVTYDSNSHTWLLIGVYTAPANASITFTNVTSANERIVVRQMVDDIHRDTESFVHTYTLVGTVLTASAPSTSYTQQTIFTVFGR
jgi:hypothetical protein